MAEKPEEKNRFGHTVKTTIPEDAPLRQNPGHKLRTSNRIVDRQQLNDDANDKSTIQEVKFEDQTGFVRLNADDVQEPSVPNRFTGPTFLNKRERFSLMGIKCSTIWTVLPTGKRGGVLPLSILIWA